MHFSLTAILVSRFMIDLHETHRALAHQGSDLSTLQIMSLHIAQPYSGEHEDMEDWTVAPNHNLSPAETEGGLENGVSVPFTRQSAQEKCYSGESQSSHDKFDGQEVAVGGSPRPVPCTLNEHPETV